MIKSKTVLTLLFALSIAMLGYCLCAIFRTGLKSWKDLLLPSSLACSTGIFFFRLRKLKVTKSLNNK